MTLVRLAPDRVPLWRDEATLQLGRRGDVVLREPEPWQERVLDALESGVEDDALGRLAARTGVDRERLEALLAQIAPALERVEAPRRLAVIAAPGVPDRLVADVLDGLDGSDWRAEWVTPEAPPIAVRDGRPERIPVVVVAVHTVPPHLCAALQRDDVPHLPIVFTAAGADVGPVVLPGRTACVSCLAAHERDLDPAWPVIATQLLTRRAPRVPLAIAAEAAALAARLLDERPEPGADASRSRSVRLGERSRRRWRSHRPHAECLCRLDPVAPRSRRGSATADAGSARIPEPTTTTAFARLA